MKEKTDADLLEQFPTDHTHEDFYLSDRDFAYVFLPNLDYEAQLDAIRNLLWRHKQADKTLSEEIKEIEAHARRLSGIQNQHAVNEWVDRMHASVYQDAAHSMAAVGMLAPLVESIFHQSFLGIGAHYASRSTHLLSHARWQQAEKDEWNCHFVWDKGKRKNDLVEGIFQLADAVGLMPHLPMNIRPMLKVLFGYRNKMFHNGFEWPVEERVKFANFIQAQKIPDHWFRAATSDDEPWIYYMTEVYVSECLSAVEQIIKAFGRFARQLRD